MKKLIAASALAFALCGCSNVPTAHIGYSKCVSVANIACEEVGDISMYGYAEGCTEFCRFSCKNGDVFDGMVKDGCYYAQGANGFSQSGCLQITGH